MGAVSMLHLSSKSYCARQAAAARAWNPFSEARAGRVDAGLSRFQSRVFPSALFCMNPSAVIDHAKVIDRGAHNHCLKSTQISAQTKVVRLDERALSSGGFRALLSPRGVSSFLQ